MAVFSGLEDMDELEAKKQHQQDQEIDDIIRMLDSKTENGVSRIKVETSKEVADGAVKKAYHHGRCDVGSPFATGQLFDADEADCGQ